MPKLNKNITTKSPSDEHISHRGMNSPPLPVKPLNPRFFVEKDDNTSVTAKKIEACMTELSRIKSLLIPERRYLIDFQTYNHDLKEVHLKLDKLYTDSEESYKYKALLAQSMYLRAVVLFYTEVHKDAPLNPLNLAVMKTLLKRAKIHGLEVVDDVEKEMDRLFNRADEWGKLAYEVSNHQTENKLNKKPNSLRRLAMLLKLENEYHAMQQVASEMLNDALNLDANALTTRYRSPRM